MTISWPILDSITKPLAFVLQNMYTCSCFFGKGQLQNLNTHTNMPRLRLEPSTFYYQERRESARLTAVKF